MAEAPIFWFTGLSGSGKSTLAVHVQQQLQVRRHEVECLDGDDMRTHLSLGLGFSREDRDINVRRIAWVARLLARHGIVTLTAAISPYSAIREEARCAYPKFIEIWCDASLEILTARDPKNLYKRALAGEIKNFTGVSDPYEPPLRPEVHLDTGQGTPADYAARIIRTAELLGHLPKTPTSDSQQVNDGALLTHLRRVERL